MFNLPAEDRLAPPSISGNQPTTSILFKKPKPRRLSVLPTTCVQIIFTQETIGGIQFRLMVAELGKVPVSGILRAVGASGSGFAPQRFGQGIG
jgi:hypothetical protein